MSDPDPLVDRFATFRDASVASTTRPGVEAVRRRVARRDATRTVAAAVLIALVAAAVLWFSRPLPPVQPTTPPRASAGTVSAVPSPSASVPVPSGSASASAPPTGGTATAPANAAAFCARRDLALVVDTDPLIPTYSDYFTRCPNSRLRVYSVTYEWDVQRQQYTSAHVDSVYLTAAHPSAARPGADLDPISSACGYLVALMQGDVDPPAALPVSVTDNWDGSYFSQLKNIEMLESSGNLSKAADLSKRSLCQPSPGGGNPT